MKRLLSLFTLSVVVLGGGLLASACNVTPPAATVNGTTISVSSLNDQLRTFDSTQAGRCLLTAETGQITPFQTTGTGGPGTYDMAFADSILENTVGNQLASQLAASKGLKVTSVDLQTAQQNFVASLSGEISAAAQQASQSGTGTYCVATSGQALTGTQVLSGLPAAMRNALIANNAVDEKLLADGANITNAAIAAYYAANRASFTTDCVSWIVTGSQGVANQYVAQLNGGAAFGAVAKAHSLDTQTAPNGGSLGCTFTQSQVLQALQVPTAPVGTPIGPVQDPSSGAWEIYEVTSQSVAPLSQVRTGVIQQLLQTTANGNRIAKEIQVYGGRSQVSIDPQYGKWKNQGVVAPVAPPAKYLLASVAGQTQTPLPTRTSSGGSGSTAPTPTTTIPSSPTSTTTIPASPTSTTTATTPGGGAGNGSGTTTTTLLAADPGGAHTVTDPTHAPAAPQTGPRIDVVGLGPAGPELMTEETLQLIRDSRRVFLRTSRHPAAAAFSGLPSFDDRYESEPTFDAVYRAIVADLVAASRHPGPVVYAVPGSPTVAERTVDLLRTDPAVASGEVTVVVHPALSFLDVAFGRLGIDPVVSGVRMVDAESFAPSAAGEPGPLLVAQCWSPAILSEIKLAVEPPPGAVATVLFHLGLDDERVWDVAWEDLDRSFEPDHLTSLWIAELAAPVASELIRLDELVHTLREQCPWDREQTHGSLARHLMEESYEVLEAIDNLAAIDARLGSGAAGGGEAVTVEAEEPAVAHLEEELGDLLFQVYFHALLAAESGRFTLADVARGVHDKLVARHPHVFGDLAGATKDQIASNWETLKMAEKNRTSITEGIPAAMPALALTAKLQRKALTVGMELPGRGDEVAHLATTATGLDESAGGHAAGDGFPDADIGELLFSVVNLARTLGVDPESALRARAAAFRASVDARG